MKPTTIVKILALIVFFITMTLSLDRIRKAHAEEIRRALADPNIVKDVTEGSKLTLGDYLIIFPSTNTPTTYEVVGEKKSTVSGVREMKFIKSKKKGDERLLDYSYFVDLEAAIERKRNGITVKYIRRGIYEQGPRMLELQREWTTFKEELERR